MPGMRDAGGCAAGVVCASRPTVPARRTANISEIIGKRSQNLTGKVMVEVASGNQQLKTAWVNQKATHANSGGEINRDEVPVEYQTYVQQYFEQVRKQDAPRKK